MKKIKKIIAGLLATMTLIAPLAFPSLVGAQQIEKNLQCGANLRFDNPAGGCETDDSGSTAAQRVDQIVSQIINILSLAVGGV
jgi:hypothetical protein